MPTYGEEKRRGFFLKNGGYYFGINDYVDAALTGGNITNGSWGLKLDSNFSQGLHFPGQYCHFKFQKPD